MKLVIRSFSTRLSLYIIIFTFLIFLATVTLFYSFASKAIEHESKEKAGAMLANTTVGIETILAATEFTLESSLWMIENNLDTPDSIGRIARQLVESNNLIDGVGIAFEPYYYKEKGKYFMWYASVEGDSVVERLLGDEDYDYHIMDWYTIPKLLKKKYWSEPYYDDGGGNSIYTTYSRPLYNKKGEFYAMFTADISLNIFTTIVQTMKPSERSYTFMLSRNGYYLTHMDSDRIMNETVFSATMDMKDSKAREIGEKMLSGGRSSILFMNDDTLSYAFFAPIEHTGWSVCTVCPMRDTLGVLYEMTWYSIVVFVLGSILLLVVCTRVIRNLTNPLTEFSESARQIAKGNFHSQLPHIKSHDEMKQLHSSFTFMQQSLTRYIEELKTTTASKERIESELSIAREIQMGMIPKMFPPFPERKDVDLYAVLRPAKEVGGDLYDFFIDGNNLFFVIGDVSGKGVPASLFMAVTRSLFRSAASRHIVASEIVHSVNVAVSETNEKNMFVTLFIGILDLESGNLQYCNAGHNPPMIISPSGDVSVMKVKPNIPVGLFDSFVFQNETCHIEKETSLFLYTDGLTEAEDADELLYSESRLLHTLRDNRSLSPKRLTEAVIQSVAQHVKGAAQSDDLTILTLRYEQNDKNIHSSITTLPNMIRELYIDNEVSEIARLATFSDELCEAFNLPPAMSATLNLVLEEAVSNVVLYAYPDKIKDKIRLSVCNSENSLIFTLADHGFPFDPTASQEVDITLTAEDRPIGGLGIFLIRKIMDSVEYQRIDNMNVLTMKKKIKN